jgi:hypothetical protein
MSKDDQPPIDSFEEEFAESPKSITAEKSSSGISEQSTDSNKLKLEDIRTAGL